MFLIQKYTQYKAAQAEQQKRKVTEKELTQLNHKIDKLLTKLDEHEPEIATNQDEECVVCVNAKATMQTYPCGHRVICRKCFVKTIQTAVAQRLLPLRCVICRAKILRLKHVNGNTMDAEDETDIDAGVGSSNGTGDVSSPTSATSSSSSTSSATSALRQTISHWYKVPQSDSLYSVTSRASSASSTASTASSFRSAASSTFASLRKSHSTYSRMGYAPLRNATDSPSTSPPSIRKLLFPKKQREANGIPKSISISTPMKDAGTASKKGIPTSRSSCQIHGQRHPQPQPVKTSSNKLPKKENRIVPVQPPKPMSMGLGPSPCPNSKSSNNNRNCSHGKSPASSPSSSTSSSVSGSNNNVAMPMNANSTPLRGKFRLVQEFQREFHQANANQNHGGGKGHYHYHHHEGLNNRTVAVGGKFRCSRPSQPRMCYCREGSGSGRPTASPVAGLPKDKSIHSISSCVAAIPSSSPSPGQTKPNISDAHGDGVVPTCSVPSSQSCPSFKQALRPPAHPRCHSHYHHHRCGGCGTDKLRKLETLIEVK